MGTNDLSPAAAKELAARLPVLDGEDAWTAEEVIGVREDLIAEIERMRRAVEASDAELEQLMGEGSDTSGKDPGDVGSTNFERDQELSMNANARTLLEQNEAALRRLEAGEFGTCENCGNPIGKARMEVFPKATMCVRCKQRAERR
ncbi:TraR/DksA family transcriptional regulator [Propionibacterium acidifaciens]|uniref:RNA polymerase-binding protein DksA n=1 Tax=Propionibacterium acidifaciens F0233 TaxID=553198 RepID=U2QE09_9ACTN|nr:TraR/DksA C4-type zinc finger protein [Propionibacterium acidifaciens]AYW78330.1 TraR/DksA family transcriptional regulator [Propionibacterium acidifaciens]ERK61100.1 putative RNA polymerase-binding protein DksA [Propionibacterium acidifaciens F0233]